MGVVTNPTKIDPKSIWEYTTRKLTNLDDTRAGKIDNCDKAISSLNDLSTTDINNILTN